MAVNTQKQIKMNKSSNNLESDNDKNEIIEQLLKFDYEYDDIIKAINSTNNKNDINEIINKIQQQMNETAGIIPNKVVYAENDNENEIIDFDCSVFESNDANIKCKSIEDGCKSTERMIYAMKYYSLLNIINNNNHKEQFKKFVNEKYKLLLEDYIHITDKHNNDLDNIYKLMIEKYNFNKCNINNCVLIFRHNRNRNYNKNETKSDTFSDENELFYIDLLDTIHTYFIHLEDIGMRIKRNEIKMNKKEDKTE
eukprot:397297_1